MGQTSTVMLIIGIIVILGSIAYTIQSVEERKRAKKLKIMSYKSTIRNALNIYKGVPQMFMTTELHDFISRYINNKWQKLHNLHVTDESQRSHNAFQERIKNKVFTNNHPQGSMNIFDDEGQVQHALSQLKATTNWLAELSKSKQISESDFNELGWQTKDAFDRVACDLQILEAIQAEKFSGEKASYHKFNIALQALGNINQCEALDSQVFEIHKHMELLKSVYEAQEAALEQARLEALEDEEDEI